MLYRISVADGQTANDIHVNIYKNDQLHTLINFHAENEFQYRMVLEYVKGVRLHRTESINALVNKLKELKRVQFINI